MITLEQIVRAKSLQAKRAVIHREFLSKLQELQQEIQEARDKDPANEKLALELKKNTRDIETALASPLYMTLFLVKK
jgi:hypothetical protein